MNNRLNKYKYPGAKRLMLEAQELKDNTEDYCAQPLEDNLFEWHFTVRGPPDTAFDGGFYHGRLSFPTEYPMKPPSIILLTPNGRFETNKKICLSISGYHPETWQPSWSVRTALLALIAFMPTKANRAIGSLDFSDAERRHLAAKSKTWRCESCGLIKELLVPVSPSKISTQENEPGTSHRVCGNDSQEKESVQADISSDKKNGDEAGNKSNSPHSSKRLDDLSSTDDSNKHISTVDNAQSLGTDHNSNETMIEASSTQSAEDQLQRCGRTSSPSRSITSIRDSSRNCSNLVFRSIFILLFLLILRRIAMAFLL